MAARVRTPCICSSPHFILLFLQLLSSYTGILSCELSLPAGALLQRIGGPVLCCLTPFASVLLCSHRNSANRREWLGVSVRSLLPIDWFRTRKSVSPHRFSVFRWPPHLFLFCSVFTASSPSRYVATPHTSGGTQLVVGRRLR